MAARFTSLRAQSITGKDKGINASDLGAQMQERGDVLAISSWPDLT
jgi:hypothetical protein